MSMVLCAQRAGEWILTVEGDFGAPEVQVLKELLRAVTPGSRIVVDFSHARGLQDFAVALAAQLLAAAKAPAVLVRGLCRHQLRLLRYVGSRLVEVAESRPGDEA